MTKLQRLRSIITGAIMISVGILMIINGEDSIGIIMGLLAFSLTLNGLRMLIYYFSMARHMVDGDQILIRGLITFDLGSFTATLTTFSQVYVMGYLIIIHVFNGFIDVLLSLESKRVEAPSWKLSLFTGIFNIGIGLACVIFARSIRTAVYVYSAGVIYSGLIKIIMAFRKTAVVYITPS